MTTYAGWKSRAPRFRWEAVVVLFVIYIACFFYPFLSGDWFSTPFIGMTTIVIIAIALLVLSLVFDITPSIVSRAEADYQNVHARDLYSLAVTFQAVPTAIPGFSRLCATRTDLMQPIGVWSLRMHHGRREDEL